MYGEVFVLLSLFCRMGAFGGKGGVTKSESFMINRYQSFGYLGLYLLTTFYKMILR